MAVVRVFSGLTTQQRRFVTCYLSGLDEEAAAREAGYHCLEQNPGRKLLHTPVILAAIHAAIRVRIGSRGVAIGLQTLERIAQDRKAPAGAQVDAAKALLDRAGVVAKKTEDKAHTSDKPLQDLSVAELEQLIKEREDAARDVTPQAKNDSRLVVPPPQDADMFD